MNVQSAIEARITRTSSGISVSQRGTRSVISVMINATR